MVIKIFQTNLNLVWNLRLAKFHFFFPNQTGIGLENPTHFWVYLFQTKLDLVWKWTLNEILLHCIVA